MAQAASTTSETYHLFQRGTSQYSSTCAPVIVQPAPPYCGAQPPGCAVHGQRQPVVPANSLFMKP